MNINLFLDSGAYSAMTQGVEVDLEALTRYLTEHKDGFTVYANLDVIGDPVRTMNNQRYMEQHNLAPLPCFHAGEPYDYLKEYVEEYDYIALGGMVLSDTFTRANMIHHLDRCWEIICDQPGRLPRCKVHGFGVTGWEPLLRYPWYSVDSTTWMRYGMYGMILVPGWGRHLEERNYINPMLVSVSSQSPALKKEYTHFKTMPKNMQEYVLSYLEEIEVPFGKTELVWVDKEYKLKQGEVVRRVDEQNNRAQIEQVVEYGVSNIYSMRHQCNLHSMVGLMCSMPEWPWPFMFKKPRLGLIK